MSPSLSQFTYVTNVCVIQLTNNPPRPLSQAHKVPHSLSQSIVDQPISHRCRHIYSCKSIKRLHRKIYNISPSSNCSDTGAKIPVSRIFGASQQTAPKVAGNHNGQYRHKTSSRGTTHGQRQHS